MITFIRSFKRIFFCSIAVEEIQRSGSYCNHNSISFYMCESLYFQSIRRTSLNPCLVSANLVSHKPTIGKLPVTPRAFCILIIQYRAFTRRHHAQSCCNKLIKASVLISLGYLIIPKIFKTSRDFFFIILGISEILNPALRVGKNLPEFRMPCLACRE